MYVSAMPGLAPSYFFDSTGACELPFPLNAPHRTFAYMARNVIYHLFRALEIGPDEVVLAPELHSGVEIWAIRAAGATVRFYPVNRRFEPDLNALRRLCTAGNVRVLYVIHVCGWSQPMQELTALAREFGVTLIEDCALSFLTEKDGRPLGTHGDYAIYCLYKFLPIPHGGLLIQNANVFEELTTLRFKPCSAASLVACTADLFQYWLRPRADRLSRTLGSLKHGVGQTLNALGRPRLVAGDISPGFSSTGFDVTKMNVGMSGLCHWLLRRFDYDAIRRRRRENFLYLRERLDGKITVLRELEPGVTPLFFPLLAHDKIETAQRLRHHGANVIEFWNYGHPQAEAQASPDTRFVRAHTLEVPVHQDLGPAQMQHLAEQVLKLDTLI